MQKLVVILAGAVLAVSSGAAYLWLRKPGPAGSAISTLGQKMSTTEGRQQLYRSVQLATSRKLLPQQYPDFGRALGLSAAELEKFSDLLAGQEVARQAILEETLPPGTNDPASMQKAQRQLVEMRRSDKTEQAEMLGNKYPLWVEYQENLPIRSQVLHLQSGLGANRLSDTQSETLIAALAAESARIMKDRDSVNRYGRLLNAAAPLLNSRQLEGYRMLLERQQAQSKELKAIIDAGK